jgi:pimeloyl-ACP methyl ester carboxylesterase
LVFSFFQTQLIFPGAATQGTRDAIVHPTRGAEIVHLHAKTGEDVAALFGPALTPDGQPRPDARHRPTILFFYGNGMCMADCEGEFSKLRRRGFNMMVAEFIGYGMSGGKPSEAGVYATADACFEHLLTRTDIDTGKIVPFGWSLGGAAAVHVASTRRVPALVVASAFTSLKDMARRLFPILPTSLVLQHHFENEGKLRDIKIPLLIVHGRHDRIVPFEMSEKLRAAAPQAQVVPIDSDHNDLFDSGGVGLVDVIQQFIERHAGDAPDQTISR